MSEKSARWEARPSDATEDAQNLTAGERIEMAFRLWDDDCALYAAANGLDLEQARRALEPSRDVGRSPLAWRAES